jgi:hypothetical protein
MPYAFAHPAAVIPLHRLLGRYAVPSALALGSVVPDAWYLLPFLARGDTHGAWGLVWFCLPAGLFAYAAFHLVFKAPVLALLPPAIAGRLCAYACRGLPSAPWPSVLACLALGSATHVAWDALTHRGALTIAFPALESAIRIGPYSVFPYQVLQHASTLLGAAFLAGWIALKLRAVPAAPLHRPSVGSLPRVALLAVIGVAASLSFAGTLLEASFTYTRIEEARTALRAAALIAASVTGAILVVYCVLWRIRQGR